MNSDDLQFIENAQWCLMIDLNDVYRNGEEYRKFILTEEVPSDVEIEKMVENSILEFGDVTCRILDFQELETTKHMLMNVAERIEEDDTRYIGDM